MTRPPRSRRSLSRTLGQVDAAPFRQSLQLAQAAISEADRRARQELSGRPRGVDLARRVTRTGGVRASKPRAPTPSPGVTLIRDIRQLFSELGLLAETVDFRQIGGWEYSWLVLLGGKDDPTRRHSSCRYSSEWCQHCGCHQWEARPWHASMGNRVRDIELAPGVLATFGPAATLAGKRSPLNLWDLPHQG